MAENGIVWEIDHVNILYGVARGGLEQDLRYGGHGDYVMNADFGKMGVQEGLFLKIRAEHRYGESLTPATGAFFPPYLITDLPVRSSEEIYLTNFLVTQALSENFAVFAGKLDTLGDPNLFASGRGKDQFSNIAFLGSLTALRTVPYATLGTGFAILANRETIFKFTVLNSTDTTRTSGFEQLFNNGATLVAEVGLPTQFLGMPGHQRLGGTWSSRNYASLDQDPRFFLPSVPIARQSGSWSLMYSFDQYLVLYDEAKNLGWGLFGRTGIADRDANPIRYFLSFGIGGNSPIAGRASDRFGFGWYYAGLSSQIDPIVSQLLGPLQDGQGLELFYNYEVTPWFHLTPDLQAAFSTRQNVSDACILGLRGKVDF